MLVTYHVQHSCFIRWNFGLSWEWVGAVVQRVSILQFPLSSGSLYPLSTSLSLHIRSTGIVHQCKLQQSTENKSLEMQTFNSWKDLTLWSGMDQRMFLSPGKKENVYLLHFLYKVSSLRCINNKLILYPEIMTGLSKLHHLH